MLRLLRTEFDAALGLMDPTEKPVSPFSTACGTSAAPWIREIVDRAAEKCHTKGTVYPILNDFFGHSVNVSGLVTGGDLIRQLRGRELGERLLLPVNMLRHGEDVFLDDVTLADVERELGVKVTLSIRTGSICATRFLNIMREDVPMAKPLVAIVGRPNVGKSMLFNKLVGQRLSIVEDTPGVTRDRLYAEAEWCGHTFDIVDTGGIEPGTDSEILTFMRRQAEIAIQNATVIVFLCDIKTGLTASDQEVANMLLRSRKPVVLAVNKADQVGPTNPDIYEFYNLGLGDPIPVSAVHGHGTGDLLDACVQHFPENGEEDEPDDVVKVAVIGKPNVGKSSLINPHSGGGTGHCLQCGGDHPGCGGQLFRKRDRQIPVHRYRGNAKKVQGR